MLTVEPARRPRRSDGKLALALAGGGPLGAFYELGALHALSESLEGRELTELDVYVGVSSGSLIAAGLANGFDTTALGAMFIHDQSTLFPFSPAILLQPAWREYLGRLGLLPQVLTGFVRQCARDPLGGWRAWVGTLGRLLPTAAFDNRPMQRHLQAMFSGSGRTDDFRRLRSRLYVVATNLNTGASMHFGEPGHDRVPISRALLASTALPGLYPAVEIGGESYVDGALIRTMHASLALEAGCDLVICVNPLVPFDAARVRSARHADLAREGLPAVLMQTFRSLIYSRMKVGMASYGARFPAADTLLFEPERHDELLFFANVFRYADRQRLADHAYQRTRRDLLARADVLAPLLQRHGLELNLAMLRRRRSFNTAAEERARRARQAPRRLDRALQRLERTLVSPRDTG